METQHAAWLRQLARDKKGGITLPSITRGEDYSLTLRFPTNQSGLTFTGTLRSGPSSDVTLASFAVTDEGWDGTIHRITFAISSGVIDGLPADGDADGLEELVFDLSRGGKRFMAGNVLISGEV